MSVTTGKLLESCRDATGPERRHLRVMGDDQPLCGTVARQDGAGAGRFSDLLRWPTCAKCRTAAEQMGPHPRQADDAPLRFVIDDPGCQHRVCPTCGRCTLCEGHGFPCNG